MTTEWHKPERNGHPNKTGQSTKDANNGHKQKDSQDMGNNDTLERIKPHEQEALNLLAKCERFLNSTQITTLQSQPYPPLESWFQMSKESTTSENAPCEKAPTRGQTPLTTWIGTTSENGTAVRKSCRHWT